MKLASSLILASFVLASASPARAFTLESAFTTGCHERVSGNALRTVRTKFKNASPIDPNRDEKALIRDLEFKPEDDMRDLGAATFLIGIRDNDLKGLSTAGITNLAQVHGNPDNQREHCLRDRGDDEPNGTIDAIAKCREFIKERITSALEGLNPDGTTDTSKRVDFEITLNLRGKVTATLPLYWFRMGQALHAVQDSFAHVYRSQDRMRIQVVLNWIDYVEAKDNESRDGPQHRNGMDECNDLDDLRTRNFQVATDATTELLAATLDPSLDRDAKLAAVDKALDKYMTVDDPSCSEANHWCNAPEEAYAIQPSCKCSLIPGDRGGAAFVGLGAAVTILAVARRRRRLLESDR